MRKTIRQFMTVTMATAMLFSTVVPVHAATFGNRFDANGMWSDDYNLTWTFFDGGSVTIGRGALFSDIHPDIKDPEYYLKEAVLYPGEKNGMLNSSGQPKANYTEGTLPLLQEFVNSFDWIHSDEATRLTKIHERIANGRNGNIDQSSRKNIPGVSFAVLQYKIGNCGNYASDFQRLASYVGLECVQYNSGPMHTATLVGINSHWITVDPFRTEELFNNTVTIPVDFNTEYNRYANEVKNSEWYQNQMQEVEWQKQAESGEITWIEYYQRLYPGMSEIEIIENFLSWNGHMEGLGN